jgi:hypothetical protein
LILVLSAFPSLSCSSSKSQEAKPQPGQEQAKSKEKSLQNKSSGGSAQGDDAENLENEKGDLGDKSSKEGGEQGTDIDATIGSSQTKGASNKSTTTGQGKLPSKDPAGAATGSSGVAKGKVLEVTTTGRVLGWAINDADLDEQVPVKFYVGGPKGTGMEAGATTAFVNGNDEGALGNHAFAADLLPAFRNGKTNMLYVYATIGGLDQLINSEPFSYTAWAPTAAGQNFFNSTINPALGGCRGCHSDIDYNNFFAKLATPAPNKGGVAANNYLINKIGGLNGVQHSGGNSCGGGANAGTCASLQTWWRMEFGTAP